MKQPMMEITDKDGKYWGIKKVVSIRWSTGKYPNGKIASVMIDFMDNGSDETLFYNRGNRAKDIYIDVNEYLIGSIISEKT